MPPDNPKLESKLDQITKDLSDMKTELRVNTLHTQQNTKSLQEHMEQTMILKREILEEKKDKELRLKPLEHAHWAWGVAGKAILATAGILSAVAGILKLVLQ